MEIDADVSCCGAVRVGKRLGGSCEFEEQVVCRRGGTNKAQDK